MRGGWCGIQNEGEGGGAEKGWELLCGSTCAFLEQYTWRDTVAFGLSRIQRFRIMPVVGDASISGTAYSAMLTWGAIGSTMQKDGGLGSDCLRDALVFWLEHIQYSKGQTTSHTLSHNVT